MGLFRKRGGDHEVLRATRVDVEPFAGLHAEFAGRDHVDEQGARGVLVLTQPVVQHAEDAQAHVQADEVRELERTHGV